MTFIATLESQGLRVTEGALAGGANPDGLDLSAGPTTLAHRASFLMCPQQESRRFAGLSQRPRQDSNLGPSD
jgi:hypothetical protein